MNDVGQRVVRFVSSGANWGGMAVAAVSLALMPLGLVGKVGWLIGAFGYPVGYWVTGMWVGFPSLSKVEWADELVFEDQDDARAAISVALSGVRSLVQANPDGRLTEQVRSKILSLCGNLNSLVEQWERSKGQLSLEGEFHARHIALTYLPEALRSFMSIPKQFAATRELNNGKTAEATFVGTLDDLSSEVLRLGDDLAKQDASAFLSHSQFLGAKFSPKELQFDEVKR